MNISNFERRGDRSVKRLSPPSQSRFGNCGDNNSAYIEPINAPPTFKLKAILTAMARRICRAAYDVTKVRVQLGRFADPLSKPAIKERIKCIPKYMTLELSTE